jgi:hypothetical protein
MRQDPAKGATLNSRDGDGRSAENILVGTAYNDELTGGKGDDILIGGDGHDTYIWNTGDGKDMIIDSDLKGERVDCHQGREPDDCAEHFYRRCEPAEYLGQPGW